MMIWFGDHASGWDWVLMTLGMVAFWGLLITVIVVLIRSPGRQPPGHTLTPSTPQQMLAAQLARGEIDGNEYNDRLAVLRGQVPS